MNFEQQQFILDHAKSIAASKLLLDAIKNKNNGIANVTNSFGKTVGNI